MFLTFMDKPIFDNHKNIFCENSEKYADKYYCKFDSSYIHQSYYEELRDEYKKTLFYDKNELVDISTIVALYSLAFLTQPFLVKESIGFKKPNTEDDIKKLTKLRNYPKEHILGYCSLIILRAYLRDKLKKNFNKANKNVVRKNILIPKHPKNIVHYFIELNKPSLLDKEKINLIFPLSQIYRAYYLEMELSFFKKTVTDLLKDKVNRRGT